MASPVNVSEALASFADIYSPRIVAGVNDYDVKIAHAKGDHVWHSHPDTDEFFLVINGVLAIDYRDVDGAQSRVTLRQGDTYVVPKGIEHRPSAPDGADILLFEPRGTLSTGDYAGAVPDNVSSTTGSTIEPG